LALACHSLFFLPYGLWRIEMNDEDLRDCFAMFALAGAMMAPEKRYDAKAIWQIADDMIEARKKENINEEDSGIAAVVPKRPRKR
jgi:hypothetical protein